ALKIAYTILHDRKYLHDKLSTPSTPTATLTTQLELIIDNLTNLMFPWISASRFKSIRALQTSPKPKSRGIIFSTGRGHFELCVHAIVSLRTILNCNLPIEVHHLGPNDLDPQMIQSFNAMPGVRTVDVWDFWGQEARNIGGWAVKPFALLASEFEQVMFLDADAVFIQSPEVLFTKSTIFKQYGQLFYHDRTITGYDWCYNWFNEFVPHISRYTNSLRFQSKNTVHEMESGVVVLDKGRTDVLMALLTTAKMNMQVERDGMTYKLMHGDKETYVSAFFDDRVILSGAKVLRSGMLESSK
ncbi:hypothetical protein HDU98_006169, partial [Podochytrium sp. JEL0797]